MKVAPKKHLGQHFLKDPKVSQRIAAAIRSAEKVEKLLEIGPGTGALTQFLIEKFQDKVEAFEVDSESVNYLAQFYPELKVHAADFLKADLSEMDSCVIVGNFPYNISSQIVFKAIENRDKVVELTGMFQKEMAKRIAAPHGNKTYGIISVIAQAFFDIEYLFTVPPGVFTPPPKVDSGVIRMLRKENFDLGCDEKKFIQVVKMAFNQRRKTMRNSLKPLLNDELKEKDVFSKRPEQLDWQEFVGLVSLLDRGIT